MCTLTLDSIANQRVLCKDDRDLGAHLRISPVLCCKTASFNQVCLSWKRTGSSGLPRNMMCIDPDPSDRTRGSSCWGGDRSSLPTVSDNITATFSWRAIRNEGKADSEHQKLEDRHFRYCVMLVRVDRGMHKHMGGVSEVDVFSMATLRCSVHHAAAC
jgi:hypothetical protein